MAVSWTRHRFSGGVLALDVTNTVVHRGDPTRRFDRFADAAEIARFAEAANRFRAGEFAGRPIVAPAREAGATIAIREATDALLRPAARGGLPDASRMPALLRACAAGFEARCETPWPADAGSGPIAFEAALAASALSLLSGDAVRRVRACPNCDWLFLDRSRNGSRTWCDMSVCGNRAKARRHYRRRRADILEKADA